MKLVKKEILKKIFKKRPKDSKKYDFGYLIIIGGSHLYSGSPALVAFSALRTGADLTLVIAPRRAADIVASFSPDLIAYPLECHDLSPKDIPTILALIKSAQKVSHQKTALVVGGGLGRDSDTQEMVRQLLSQINIPVVVDADAIWAISQKKEEFAKKKFVLTPHQYEFFVLSGKDISKLTLQDKAKEVQKLAQEFSWTILLKGNVDIISDGKEVFFNKTGTPAMTVGGTGDTLAGICGALLSQGFDPLLSALASAYINGKAGELATKEFGVGMTASDLLKFIPKVIKNLT